MDSCERGALVVQSEPSAQRSSVLGRTVLHRAVQCCAMLCSVAPCCAVLRSAKSNIARGGVLHRYWYNSGINLRIIISSRLIIFSSIFYGFIEVRHDLSIDINFLVIFDCTIYPSQARIGYSSSLPRFG